MFIHVAEIRITDFFACVPNTKRGQTKQKSTNYKYNVNDVVAQNLEIIYKKAWLLLTNTGQVGIKQITYLL